MSENVPLAIVSVSDIVSFVRRYFFLFLIVGVVGAVAGYLLSYRYQNQYKSIAVVLPEYSASTSMGLGELAGLARLMGKNRTEALRPDLYPDILSSYHFLIDLASSEFTDSKGEKVYLSSLLTNDKADEEDAIEPFDKEKFKDKMSVISLSRNQSGLIKDLRSRLMVDYGKITGVITISAEFPDPLVAAEVVEFSIHYLENFVSEYRTGKLSDSFLKMEERLATTKKEYHSAEVRLNAYKDMHRNAFTNISRVEEQRLETEFQRTKSNYLDAAQKFEAAKQQISEEAAVLKVLDPPVVPHATSKPRRLIMALVSGLFFGFVCLLIVLFGREKIHRKFTIVNE